MFTQRNWERSKSQLKHYKRRTPEKSALYRVVYHGRDELERHWEERFQGDYGVLRDEVKATFDEYLNCGLLCHGAARLTCASCQYSTLVAFSCKKRGVCPSCGAKRAVKFAEHLYDEILLPVEHRHIVFSLPKRLRSFFRYDRTLLSSLFQAAWGSVKTALGNDAGLILTAQTAGEAINWNPHLHGLLTNGTLNEAGEIRQFENLDLKAVTQSFAERVLGKLQAAELITDADVVQVLSQEHSGFSVWLGEPFHDVSSEKFVARYIERGPVSLEKLSIQDDIISYATKNGKTHEFDTLEFLALLSAHIPRPYESITRFYGLYSCRRRGDKIRQQKELEAKQTQPTPETREPQKRASITWATCIKRIYEINPLECPRCKCEMQIVAFVQDQVEIKKTMESQGIPDFTAPPPIPKEFIPPAQDFIPDYETFVEGF